MIGDPHRRIRRTIAAHFGAGSSLTAEQEMRRHLRDCDTCLELYGRHLLLNELDPEGRPPRERLARGLGLPRRRLRPPTVYGFGLAAVAAAMGAVLLMASRRPGPAVNEAGFAARGAPVSAATAPELMVYRIPARGARAEPAGGILAPGDELAFAYRNGAGAAGSETGARSWLMIFAVDEHGHVFWYHPGWAEGGEPPAAVPAERTPGIHELSTAVAHRFDGEKLVVHALFSDHRLTARQVEAAVRTATADGGAGVFTGTGGATLGVLRLPDSLDVRRPFRVVP